MKNRQQNLNQRSSKPTLIKWAQDDRTARDIHNLHALFIDELQEKNRIGKQHRLEFFGELLSKAKEELATRDFSDIPTDKLVVLALKTSSAIKTDEQQFVIKGDREFGLFELSHDRTWRV
jgi:hypothetical protein